MGCIGRTEASVRSGAAGDAVRIGKASRRGAVITQGFENAVQPMINTPTGS